MMRGVLQFAIALLLGVMLLGGSPANAQSNTYPDTSPAAAQSPSDFTIPQGTTSNGTLQTAGKDGTPRNCATIEEARAGVIIGKLVPCLVKTISTATETFTEKMVKWLRPLLYTFLVLVITLYGVRVATGEPEIHKQGFLLLVKVALVITILDMIPTYFVPKTYEIMNQSQQIIMGALDKTDLKCPKVEKFGDDKTPPVWKLMDCIGGKIFGYSAGVVPGSANMLLVTSLLGLLSGFLFGGTWGVVVFFGMVGVIVSMFMLIVRVITAFLTGYLTVCLMLIISPLLMPLIFMRGTSMYFEGVWKNILAGFLMPIIVTSYAMLALMLYDRMLFAEDSMVQSLFNYSKVSNALEEPKKACNREMTGNPTDLRADGKPEADVAKLLGAPFIQTIMTTLSGGNDACSILPRVPQLNMKNIRDSRFAEGKEAYNKIFENLVVLFVLAWLIQQGTERLNGIMRQLVGAGVAAMSMSGVVGESEAKISAATNNMKQTAMNSLGDKSGADFLKATPNAVKESAKAFYGGVKRR